MPTISQTSMIFFFLFIAFVIYITSKGELASYAKVFYG